MRTAQLHLQAPEDSKDSLPDLNPGVEDADLAAKQAEIDAYKERTASYVQQEKERMAKTFGGSLGVGGFDFSGKQSIPTPARGKDGLNEQGYGSSEVDPEPEKVGSVPVYMVGLGLAGVASVALSVNNMMASST